MSKSQDRPKSDLYKIVEEMQKELKENGKMMMDDEESILTFSR